MQQHFLFLCLILTSFSVSSQDCPIGDLIIQSQAELDQFKIDFPNCKNLVDDVKISGVSNLDAFSEILNVEGNFDLTNCPLLESLSGLENLKSVNNRLSISHNNLLADLSALNNLQSVGAYLNPSTPWTLIISENNSLRFIDGFENLLSCGNAEINVGDNPLLESISGFNNLVNGKGIRIQRNDQLSTINGFSSITGYGSDAADSGADSLNYIRIFNCPVLSSSDGFGALELVSELSIGACNNLESIPFKNSLRVSNYLSLSDNESLISFDKIIPDQKMETIYISNQKLLPDLFFLNNVREIETLRIINNPGLKSLAGLTSLSRIIGRLSIADNPNLANLEGQKIDSIGGSFVLNRDQLTIKNNDQLVSLNGLSQLEYLTGGFYIDGNEKLRDVSLFENMELIGYLPSMGTRYDFRGFFRNNPQLNKCDYLYICNGINFEDYFMSANGATCSEKEDVLNLCDSTPRAQISYFLDLNGNGIKDTIETFYFGSSVKVEPIDTEYFVTDQLGPPLYLQEGDYNFLPQIDQSKWDLTTDHKGINFGSGEYKRIEIGIKALYEEARIEKSLFLGARCNTMQRLYTSAKNVGTESISGTLWLSVYPAGFQASLAAVADTIDGFRIGWTLPELAPSHSFRRYVEVTIPGPPDANVGEGLTFQLDADLDNADYQDESLTYSSPIMCAWDPNDKLVVPNRPNQEILEEDTLLYTIRFQNTGNDYAEHVFIIDSLDVDFLDISTIEFVDSSHPDKLVVTLERSGVLRFDFPHIFLPDSTADNSGSQGFVTFKIGIRENTLIHQDVIRNNADIYFDANPPVRTNRTRSVFVNDLSAIEDQNFETEKLAIFPNPTDGYIQFSRIVNGRFELYDLCGNLIVIKDLTDETAINLSMQPSGLYLLKVYENNSVYMQKVVIDM